MNVADRVVRRDDRRLLARRRLDRLGPGLRGRGGRCGAGAVQHLRRAASGETARDDQQHGAPHRNKANRRSRGGRGSVGRGTACTVARPASHCEAMVSKKTKARAGVKGAKLVARHPMLRRATLRAARPAGNMIVKRRVRRQVDPLGDTARTIGDIVFVLVVYGPELARELGLVQAPQRKRTVLLIAVGVAVGAGAVYLLKARRDRSLEPYQFNADACA